MQKLWYREFDDWWYVTIRENGKRVQKKLVKGADQEDAAEQAFHRLMVVAGEEAPPVDMLFGELVDLFLIACEEETPDSFEWYRRFLQSFIDSYKGTVSNLKPLHVNGWLKSKPKWKQGTQRQAIVCVKRVINWAFDEGYITQKPLRKLKRPPMPRREVLVAKKTHTKILKETDEAFTTFLTALRETGARPGEIRTVTAAMVNLKAGVWTLPKHKTADKTGKPRTIYLTPVMVKLTAKLMKQRPSGPLFLNSRGEPWKANAVRCRMRRLREKLELPAGTVAYSYRHSYATNALENGLSDVQTAELLGHADTKMIKTYGHLDQKTEFMRKVAQKGVK